MFVPYSLLQNLLNVDTNREGTEFCIVGTGVLDGPYNAREDTLSLFCAYCEKHGLISIIVRTLQPSGLSIFKFIHFHHPYQYNANRQRKQVLCRNFSTCHFSTKNAERKRTFSFLCRLDYSFTKTPVESREVSLRVTVTFAVTGVRPALSTSPYSFVAATHQRPSVLFWFIVFFPLKVTA